MASKTSPNALTGLLTRLDTTLHSPSHARALKTSPYLRTKLRANLDYARTTLLRLEQEPTSQTQKRAADLQQKRAQLKVLQARLDELARAADEDDPASSSDSDGEDLLNRYAPAVADTSSGIDTEEPDTTTTAQTTTVQTTTAHTTTPATQTSTLRARRPGQQVADTTAATTTGSAAPITRPAPTSSVTPFPAKPTTITPADGSEALLAHHADEQEAMTASLLALATRLKESTLEFSETLAGAEPLVERAAAALDRNVLGLGAAEKRMGALRRMVEGKGWLGRLSLYAWIAVAWVVLIFIMFVMPKLRF